MSGATARPSSRRRALRRLGAAAAIAAVFLLTACGAVVNTTLVVNADGSGTRNMTATIAASDMEQSVPGGSGAVDAVIKEHLPAGLEYSGVTTDGEGNATFAFSIPFADEQEYEEKVISILGAGGVVSIEADTQVVIADTVFRKGVSVEENFTSQDLLTWLVNALVDSGTLTASNKSSASELGTTAVEIDGVGHETNAAIEYSNVIDYGVRGLEIVTAGIGSDEITRTIRYDLAREAYASDPEGFDAFFEKATPKGGELEKPADAESIWTLTFTADDPKSIVKATNQALGSETTDFAVSQKIDAADDGVIATTVVDYFDCSAICADDAEIVGAIETPSGWQSSLSSTSAESKTQWSTPGTRDPIEFRYRVPFESVVITAEIAPDAESTLNVAYLVGAEEAALLGDQLESVIAPGEHAGTVSLDEGDDGVTATATITASTPEALTEKAAKYLPGFRAGANVVGGDLFSQTYVMNVDVSAASPRFGGGVTDGVTYEVIALGGSINAERSNLPDGAQVDGGRMTLVAPEGQPATFSAQTTAIKLVSVIVTVGVALLIVAAVVVGLLLLLRHRRPSPVSDAPTAIAPPPPLP